MNTKRIIGKTATTGALALALSAAALNGAFADSAPGSLPTFGTVRPGGVILTVNNDFGARDGAVRISVYEAENFLEEAILKLEAEFRDGVAYVPVDNLNPGDYAFVAYYDKNRDGKLNRNVVGAPKEPFGISNGVRPKLAKPKFDQAKIAVSAGSVIPLTIED